MFIFARLLKANTSFDRYTYIFFLLFLQFQFQLQLTKNTTQKYNNTDRKKHAKDWKMTYISFVTDSRALSSQLGQLSLPSLRGR